VLVTGAQGQLARSLAERARRSPTVELVAVGRPKLELELPARAEETIAAIAPDWVINAAAYTGVDDAERDAERAFRINAEGAGAIAAAAAAVGAAIIQISTDYVFDGAAADPYDETAKPNPLGVYGRSKLAGEEQVRLANRRHLIVRTAWLYSPFGKNFVKTMMNAARSRDVLRVVDDQRGSPTSAADLADALFRMIEVGPRFGETYHVAGTGSASWHDFAQAIMDDCRRRGAPAAEVHPVSSGEWPTRAIRPSNSALNSGKFAKEFKHELPDWRSSLAATIEGLLASAS
jgi:dTDP-4-dehydrorhamnose reductase